MKVTKKDGRKYRITTDSNESQLILEALELYLREHTVLKTKQEKLASMMYSLLNPES